MIYLIVGQPRSGKSQKAVALAFEFIEKNDFIKQKIDQGRELADGDLIRPIYSDIDEHALRSDGKIKVAPPDWRDVEDNSIIFYDEVHFRDEFLDQNKYMSQNPMIKELSIHGHRNIDIYLMTQDPRRLEKSIRALISKMYLVKRPANNPNFANVYTFDRWLGDPWAASKNPDNVHDTKIFKYKKKYQDAYKSASAHTSISFKLQNKFIVAIISIICMIGLAVFLFKISGMGGIVSNAMDAGKIKEQTKVDDKAIMASAYGHSESSPVATVDCRQAVNVDLPQCKNFYNDLSKNQGSMSTGDKGQIIVSYNPNEPFNNENIQKSITYEVTSKPVFSGCAKFNGEYIAYTQQGTRLKVSQADCRRLINDGDRPFNYFAEEKAQVQPTSATSDENYKKSYLENIARLDAERYAKAQDAVVKSEQIPLGTPTPRDISGANSL